MPIERPGACLLAREEILSRLDVTAAVEEVRRSSVALDIRTPPSPDALKESIPRAIEEGASRIVVAGGDGTLNAAVDALMGAGLGGQASLGLLPLGTANDFAKSARIPASDLAEALTLACVGQATAIDVGHVNGSYFVNTASLGFGARVTATTPQDMKKLLGGTAYSIMGLVHAFQAEPHEGRLTLPCGETIEAHFLIMVVGNGRFAGGGFDVAPRASLTDGLLDIALITETATESIGTLLDELSDPAHPENEHVYYRQVPGFTLETTNPLHVTLDGEPTTGSRFEFRCSPQALSMVLGADPLTARQTTA
ncbi:YegS/Rv2252/BmrU family lipid kinase [Methyloceanibacter sp. wino2]|uniref:YegS/Rv2252/BmrU family lipid kinase n=1 Tax=Methyloceanibacter sp. wino2 TaxID=2170729 RepID=UPI000D3E8236|nr:YegS/Rv2252/BmrU family lipid kinase [Methyloceanibacter sp. wino2]